MSFYVWTNVNSRFRFPMERYQRNILFRNIPMYILNTIPMEYIVQEYPCSAQYQWKYIVQEYPCLHVQYYTDGIYCLLFRNIPVYMFSTIPREYIVYCSGIFLSTCSALYRWNILFTVQEYPCVHVQHYTDGNIWIFGSSPSRDT